MDEEAEDRFTELARTRLADTLSEAARLLSGPSSDPAPTRRTERLGIDEVLLGLSRHPTLGLVPHPDTSEAPATEGPPESPATTDPRAPSGTTGPTEPGTARSPAPHRAGAGESPDVAKTSGMPSANPAETARVAGSGIPARPAGLRTEVDQLRADVETARQRVEAAEARAEEHEAALEDLRVALARLRRAGLPAPPYERPGFANVVIRDTTSAGPTVPVVAFALGTMPSPPPVLHAARLGTSRALPAQTLTAKLVTTDRTTPDSSAPGPATPEPPAVETITTEPATVDNPTGVVGEAEAAGGAESSTAGPRTTDGAEAADPALNLGIAEEPIRVKAVPGEPTTDATEPAASTGIESGPAEGDEAGATISSDSVPAVPAVPADTAGSTEARSAEPAPVEPHPATPALVEPRSATSTEPATFIESEGANGARSEDRRPTEEEADGYPWPFAPSAGRHGRRRFWHRQ